MIKTKFSLTALTDQVRRRPKMIGLILSGLIIAWLAWQMSGLLTDQTITESDIVSRRTSLDRGRYDQLMSDLDVYHQPAGAPALNQNLFPLQADSGAAY